MSERKAGATLAYVQIFLNIGVALAFTPVLVKSLGQSGYGLYSIVGSFVLYLTVMDMGMNDSTVRYLIQHRTKGDNTGAQQFLGSMMSIYAIVGLAILVAAALVIALMPRIFSSSMTRGELELLQAMFLIAAVATAMTISLNPVGALVYASERFIFIRMLEMTVHVASTMLMYVLLQYGMGALMVVAVSYGSLVAASAVKFLFARFALHERIGYRRFSWQGVRPVVMYSAPIFIATIVELIYWRLDNILVGAFIGAAAVAVYAIGVMFQKYFMSFATAISRVMVPEVIRRVDAGAAPAELTSLLVRVARAQAIVLMLVLTGLIIFGDEFIVLWLGPEYSISFTVMLLALCPFALDLMGNLRNAILQAKNLYWHRVSIFAVMALLNIPLTIGLLKAYGVAGAAASTGICILIGHVLILRVLEQKTGIRMSAYYTGLSRGLAPTTLACLVIGWLLDAALPTGWRVLAAKVTAYTLMYLWMLWCFGLDHEERIVVRSAIGGALRGAHGR